MASDAWGPFESAISPAERLARLRSLRAICICGPWRGHVIVKLLFLAESLEPGDLQAAALEIDRMPALSRRNLISIYGRLISEKNRVGAKCVRA